MIDTVPLPERVFIPREFLREFEREKYVAFRTWAVGIPVPEVYLQTILKHHEGFKILEDNFELLIVPKERHK